MEMVKREMGSGDGGDPGSKPFIGETACQMITAVRIEYYSGGGNTFIRWYVWYDSINA